jgi:hypothetical protein
MSNAEEIFTEMVFTEISRRIVKYEDTSEQFLISSVLPWLRTVLFKFLNIVLVNAGNLLLKNLPPKRPLSRHYYTFLLSIKNEAC